MRTPYFSETKSFEYEKKNEFQIEHVLYELLDERPSDHFILKKKFRGSKGAIIFEGDITRVSESINLKLSYNIDYLSSVGDAFSLMIVTAVSIIFAYSYLRGIVSDGYMMIVPILIIVSIFYRTISYNIYIGKLISKLEKYCIRVDDVV